MYLHVGMYVLTATICITVVLKLINRVNYEK